MESRGAHSHQLQYNLFLTLNFSLKSPPWSVFFKSDFDLEILISPNSLNGAVGTGDSSLDITSLMLISRELVRIRHTWHN